ncbi:MAG TPA: hypothetical protein VHK69_19220 [Chitinophagaceae bacterium]|jgi:hypothetical protein|nr:hypothetical protein [Chitinophagaceae bacterium]
MKASEFILLPEKKKQLAVLHEGVLVAKRSSPEQMVFLFDLGLYYVETFCNRSSKAIEEYRVLDGTGSLQPYLETIPIDHLLQ